MKNFIYIFILLLFACNPSGGADQNNNPSALPDTKSSSQPQSKANDFNRYFEDENETISFFVEAKNGENSSVRIRTRGLDDEYDHAFEVEGQMVAGHLLDMDSDGYKELYLVYKYTDDSGNLGLWAVASDRNLKAKEVKIEDTNQIRKMNSDRVFQSDKKLMRSMVDENGTPLKFTYQLNKTGDSFVLSAAPNG